MSDKKDDVPWSASAHEPKEQNITDKKDDVPWSASAHEPKEQNITDKKDDGPWSDSTLEPKDQSVSDKKDDVPWTSSTHKAKEQNLSEIMQKGRADESDGSAPVDLRQELVQRTMDRHGFTEDQALALIHAFGG